MKLFFAMAALVLTSCAPLPISSGAPGGTALDLPPMLSFTGASPQPPARANSEIAQDFLDLVFRMESGRAIPTMTRFEGEITVGVQGDIPASLLPDLDALLGRLRGEAGLNIHRISGSTAAITIHTIPQAVLNRAVPQAACFVVPRISSWQEFERLRRSPQVDWTTLTRRDRAAIFIPSDAAPQEIRDCLHEELAQALGPLNDLYRLPDSVFNDDNIHAVLTGFDMLILRAYYAPELRNGMSRGEAAARLPALLARLNPAGQRSASAPQNDTPRDWIDAVETALSGGTSAETRRRAADQAVVLARAYGWNGNRRGFSFYAYGRIFLNYDAELALNAFQHAATSFDDSTLTRLHWAHTAVQLAAFSLSSGDAETTISLTQAAIPTARANQNAALLATLMMFQAEALEYQGHHAAAEQLRLDSLGWARYGFGAEVLVRARQMEIAALRPQQPQTNVGF